MPSEFDNEPIAGPSFFGLRKSYRTERSKRIGSRYVSGRTRAWLKTKNPNFERHDSKQI
jgi:hypothetical protein